uniref:Uncharacterized protein n=1 Tax=Oryza punctata TaxID=4537 RepID=A0A0E0KHE7_ORYPU
MPLSPHHPSTDSVGFSPTLVVRLLAEDISNENLLSPSRGLIRMCTAGGSHTCARAEPQNDSYSAAITSPASCLTIRPESELLASCSACVRARDYCGVALAGEREYVTVRV